MSEITFDLEEIRRRSSGDIVYFQVFQKILDFLKEFSCFDNSIIIQINIATHTPTREAAVVHIKSDKHQKKKNGEKKKKNISGSMWMFHANLQWCICESVTSDLSFPSFSGHPLHSYGERLFVLLFCFYYFTSDQKNVNVGLLAT